MRNPVRSLPTRIVFFVFAATLIASLTVTAVSVSSIDSFLRGNINQRFPVLLSTTSEQLESWYEQRNREMSVFSQSDILLGNMSVLAETHSTARLARARAEIEQYVSYVLDGFPQYASILVLGREGEILLSVGETVALSQSSLDELANVDSSRIGPLERLGDKSYQIASAPLSDSRKRRLGSLHAVLRASALRASLPTQEMGPGGRILVIADDGRCVVGSDPESDGIQYIGPMPEAGGASNVQDYRTEAGERVVGDTLAFPRFGFTLVVEQPYSQAFAPVVGAIGQVLVINLGIVLIMGLAAFRIAVSIVRPIEALSDAAERISEGERNVVIPDIKTHDEVGVLTRAFSEMTNRLTNNAAELELSHTAVEEANEQLQRQNDELQRVNEVLEQLSITDGLTKLHNHRYFQEALVQECKRA
jgi:HAMP domain-containing protein